MAEPLTPVPPPSLGTAVGGEIEEVLQRSPGAGRSEVGGHPRAGTQARAATAVCTVAADRDLPVPTCSPGRGDQPLRCYPTMAPRDPQHLHQGAAPQTQSVPEPNSASPQQPPLPCVAARLLRPQPATPGTLGCYLTPVTGSQAQSPRSCQCLADVFLFKILK